MPRGEGGDPAMAHRLFEGKEHAEAYLRFRVSPSDQLIQQVVDYVQKQVGPISRMDRGQCGCTTHVASCISVHNAIYGNTHTHTHTHTEQTHVCVATCCVNLLFNMRVRVLCFRQKGGPFDLALDVGCGSGQGSTLLAKHFASVVATDISPAQIEMAMAHASRPNVMYK